jgi:hypothetical protein
MQFVLANLVYLLRIEQRWGVGVAIARCHNASRDPIDRPGQVIWTSRRGPSVGRFM